MARDLHVALTLIYLLDYDGGDEAVRLLASSWSTRLWDEAPTLYCRHHLLPVAAKLVVLGDARGLALMARAIEDDPGAPPLAVEALALLGGAKGALASDAAAIALGAMAADHPGVRAEAATCLRRLGAKDDDVSAAALAVASGDPWPEVRLSALRLVASFDEIPVESMYTFLEDPDSNVRKEAVRLAVSLGLATEEIGILLANTTVDPSMRGDVRAEAAHAIGSLCIVEMAMPLGNVIFYGIVPGATEAQIQTAAAAADALGRLGDPGPLDKLIMATSPGLRLQIRLAAIEALGLIADPEAIAALTQLAASPDPAIADKAREALALVEAGATTSACAATD